jgi:hypothetical protein
MGVIISEELPQCQMSVCYHTSDRCYSNLTHLIVVNPTQASCFLTGQLVEHHICTSIDGFSPCYYLFVDLVVLIAQISTEIPQAHLAYSISTWYRVGSYILLRLSICNIPWHQELDADSKAWHQDETTRGPRLTAPARVSAICIVYRPALQLTASYAGSKRTNTMSQHRATSLNLPAYTRRFTTRHAY